MAKDRSLRVYFGPDDQRSVPLSHVENAGAKVEIPLQQLFDTLTDATVQGLAWTEDFRDEQVTVSADLYEVIAAYKQLRRSA